MIPDDKCIGVDVSYYNENVDWKVLAGAGVKFAFARCTQGNYIRDTRWYKHAQGILDAGIVLGTFHFQEPGNDSGSQVDWILRNIGNFDVRIFALDVERNFKMVYPKKNKPPVQQKMSDSALSSNAYGTLAGIKKSKRFPKTIVYTRQGFVYESMPSARGWLRDEPLWLAEYADGNYYRKTIGLGKYDAIPWKEYLPRVNFDKSPRTNLLYPSNTGKDWWFWQYSGDRVWTEGAGGYIEIDIFNGSYDELLSFSELSIPPVSPPCDEETELLKEVNSIKTSLAEIHERVNEIERKIKEM